MKSLTFLRSFLAIWLSALSLLLVACAGKNESPNQSSPANTNAQAVTPDAAGNRNAPGAGERLEEPGDSSPGEFQGSTGSTIRAGFEVAPALLREVRTAQQNGFDRVVFEFEGSEIPNYSVDYAKKPVSQCGSGDVVQMTGNGLLQVLFKSTDAHTQDRPTVADRERRLNLPILKELRFTCDFEAQVVVVLGVASPNPYRVTHLYNPTRVVVDVKH